MAKSNDRKSKVGQYGAARRNPCGHRLTDHGANAVPRVQFRKLLDDLIARRLLAGRSPRRTDHASLTCPP
jgi:hypothetical protein